MAKVEEFKIAGKTHYRIELTQEEMDLIGILMDEGIAHSENLEGHPGALELFNELSGGP